jgi:hypothetical protein
MHNGILSTFIQYVKCILCWYTKIFYTDEVNATDDFSCYSNVCVSGICVWIIMKLRFVKKANKNIYIYIYNQISRTIRTGSFLTWTERLIWLK